MVINVGIIGTGTVGLGALQILDAQSEFFQASLGLGFNIVSICAKTEEELKQVALFPMAERTTDAISICKHPGIDVVIELAGGYELPKQWIATALSNGKHIVTANKALLAKYGPELFPLASQNKSILQFEAAVGGGIPIISSLRDSLIANNIEGLASIINGTCNYILSEMTQKSIDFEECLRNAQELGYAEADPTFDIEGVDSAHKAALMASLCYGKYVDFQEMSVEGITQITKLDVQMAEEMGYVIKLLATLHNKDNGKIHCHVYPALLKKSHQLATVNDVLNAVFIKSSYAGDILLTGAGAGRLPTASAIISDLVAIGNHIKHNSTPTWAPDFINSENKAIVSPINDLQTEFYIRLTTKDEIGVLAKITRVLADYCISIDSIIQKSAVEADSVPIIIQTHRAKNADVVDALSVIDRLEVVTAKSRFIRFY